MWKKYCRAWLAIDDNITRHTRIACWITKATNTHSEYAIIFAFPLQQWLHDRAPSVSYTYSVGLLLFLYHPNSRAENISIFLFSPLKFSSHKKLTLGRKNSGGAYVPQLHSPFYDYDKTCLPKVRNKEWHRAVWLTGTNLPAERCLISGHGNLRSSMS
jgi:hypothetical protein